jgi:type IV secretory pathway VirJ component
MIGLRFVFRAALALSTVASSSLGAAQSTPRASTLPLSFFAPVGADAHVTAVLLTGDGGWAELAKEVALGLAAHGIGVVGFNSRAWLSEPRTPQATTDAIVVAIAAARARWPADRLVLVGYSRGADMAPFIATRLPAPLRSQLSGLAVFGLARAASFEFHLMDLVKDTPRATDLPMLPELEKLRGVRMRCVYGLEETDSGCRDAPADLIVRDGRPGGHHFDRNIDALVAHVLALLTPP